MLAMNRSKDIN